MIKLVVALGNPGVEYSQTRHNIAWLAFERLKLIENLNWKSKFKGQYADLTIKGEKVFFLLPQTYMNLSGESVLALASFFKIKPNEILVIHDEIDLDFGLIMFKKGGGAAGNNGLKSITQCLGTNDFLRLRLGVSKPSHGNVASYVLSRFSSDEQIVLDNYLDFACEAIELALSNGFQKAANKYSKQRFDNNDLRR